MTYPHLTSTPRRGDPRCGSQPAANAPTCGLPATWHIAWSLTPGNVAFSLVCDAHMAMAQRSLAYADRHPVEVACDLPGTGWELTDPSRCVIATTADTAAQRGRERP